MKKYKMDAMIKRTIMDLYYTLLDSEDILDIEKESLFRKHNHLFIQVGKCLIHFYFYSRIDSFNDEHYVQIYIVHPITFLPLFTYHPSFYSLKMINSTSQYDFLKIIQEIKKLRPLLNQ